MMMMMMMMCSTKRRIWEIQFLIKDLIGLLELQDTGINAQVTELQVVVIKYNYIAIIPPIMVNYAGVYAGFRAGMPFVLPHPFY